MYQALTSVILLSACLQILGLPVDEANVRGRQAKQFTNSTSVVSRCGPSTANIVCINRYASVLPPDFSRGADASVGYSGTVVPEDASWQLLANASFMIFDQARGLELLGPAPKLEKMFDVLDVIHEGPVYVPSQNRLYINQYGPPGNSSQLLVDLNVNPPTLSTYQTIPPTYQPIGGILRDGMIYWTVDGYNDTSAGGVQQRPGIWKMNPQTYEAETILNNYFGFFFSGPNDLTIDSQGDIWFTDSDYGYVIEVDPNPPQIQLLTYRFRPSTGAVTVVEDTLSRPNGIGFSPDGKTLYIGDSGLEHYGPLTTFPFYEYPINIEFNATGKRNVYAFDVNRPESPVYSSNGTLTGTTNSEPYLTNKRVIYQSVEGAPDGFKVAANGYLLAASGLSNGVDILDPSGALIARIEASHPVENFQWTGENLETLWLTGIGGISRVEWNLPGPRVS